MSLEPTSYVPRFKTRKEFMEFLADLMTEDVEEEVETELLEETRGRPRELKTYVMESNTYFAEIRDSPPLKASKYSTKLPEISVLRMELERKSATFYVDETDKRFLIFYTNDLADEADVLYNHLVFSTTNSFDKIWLPTEILDMISHLPGNLFRGFGLMFDDLFAPEEREEQPIHELRMNVAGSSSGEALEALNAKEKLRRSLSRSMIRVFRGNRSSFVTDELRHTGRLITKYGASIDDHVSLVETTKKIYRNLVEEVERESIGTRQVEGRTLIEGRAFDLVLERQIDDIDKFVDQLLAYDAPFRLWGLRNKVSPDMNQIVAVDLHTGNPMDLEVMRDLIRVYLPKGACGNTILRLYTNLQHTFDSAIRLNGEKLPLVDS